MTEELTPKLLIVSGPVGVGKTTVGHELSERLCDVKTAHTFVDLDALAQTYPRPDDDRFGTNLALRNLAAIWANCRAEGSKVLIISRVVETPGDVGDIERAVSISPAITCQLRASEEILVDRLERREIGSGLAWHKKRAVELARLLNLSGPANFSVDTDDRRPAGIADEVLRRAELWV